MSSIERRVGISPRDIGPINPSNINNKTSIDKKASSDNVKNDPKLNLTSNVNISNGVKKSKDFQVELQFVSPNTKSENVKTLENAANSIDMNEPLRSIARDIIKNIKMSLN